MFASFHSMQKNDSLGMSKRSYIEAVLEGLRAVSSVDVAFTPYSEELTSLSNPVLSVTNDICNGSMRKKIFVRLLLSIDRRETAEAAMETVSYNAPVIWAFFFSVLPLNTPLLCRRSCLHWK